MKSRVVEIVKEVIACDVLPVAMFMFRFEVETLEALEGLDLIC